MSLSSFCVVSNALRLNLCRVHDGSHDRPFHKKMTPKVKTIKTVRIKGMMCEHCENHVKTALEALPGVLEAVVSHKEGTAILTTAGPLNEKQVKKAVKEAGYKVLSIK